MPVIVFFCGLGTGVAGTLAVVALYLRDRAGDVSRELPPATASQIRHARRASRLVVATPLTSTDEFDNEVTR